MKTILHKLLLMICSTIFSLSCYSQIQNSSWIEDTVYVASNQTAMLIFESSVNLIDLGTNEYHAKKAGNMVLLRPAVHNPKMASLLIAYGDGRVFSGFVAYSSSAEKPIYDYRESMESSAGESIYSQSPVNGLDLPLTSIAQDLVREVKDISQQTAWNKDEIAHRKRYPKAKSGDVYAYIKPLAYDTSLTYISCLLENKSPIPFKVDYVGVKIFEPSSKKGLGNIEVESQILSKNIPAMINRFEQAFAYLAIPTFATTKKGWLEIHITEKQGTRSLLIKVRHKKKVSFHRMFNFSWLSR